jgi:hypothetical protein
VRVMGARMEDFSQAIALASKVVRPQCGPGLHNPATVARRCARGFHSETP